MKIEDIIKQLREGNLDDPVQLANFLVMLSASKMDARNYEAEAFIEMKKKWLELKNVLLENGKLKTDKTIDAEIALTEQWRQWRKMHDAIESIQDCEMSLKKKLSTVIY